MHMYFPSGSPSSVLEIRQAVQDVFVEMVEPKTLAFRISFHVGYGSIEDGYSPGESLGHALDCLPCSDLETVDDTLDTRSAPTVLVMARCVLDAVIGDRRELLHYHDALPIH